MLNSNELYLDINRSGRFSPVGNPLLYRNSTILPNSRRHREVKIRISLPNHKFLRTRYYNALYYQTGFRIPNIICGTEEVKPTLNS